MFRHPACEDWWGETGIPGCAWYIVNGLQGGSGDRFQILMHRPLGPSELNSVLSFFLIIHVSNSLTGAEEPPLGKMDPGREEQHTTCDCRFLCVLTLGQTVLNGPPPTPLVGHLPNPEFQVSTVNGYKLTKD